MESNFIRFDWAAKRLLRQKSNFVVLEGLLSTLLKEDIRIVRMLESEDSEENAADKYWRIDMLAENSKGEQILVEIRNDHELAYFHRMLYGVPKAITEYVKEEAYAQVKKLYLISIVYFDVGKGEDYVYRGRTGFTGLHKNDVLRFSGRQHEQFTCKDTGDLFTEYYILRVCTFDENIVTSLDEWIQYLKTCDIPDNATAKGLPEARERLCKYRMDRAEQSAYNAHTEALEYQRSVIQTGLIEGRAQGREIAQADDPEEAQAKFMEEVILTNSKAGLSVEIIAKITGYTTAKVAEIIQRRTESSSN